ncbi:hypothetical protein FOZ60_009363 [Perkinsus olseni]|uniref:Uncharacterized protein n=1 Tax=Perkinsus olseni TaxID=32597 RepID=A0A7J6NIM1_PEROL|nr:hypothetical protein FOZ60_009363 [Perkinsus olseni]
MVHLPVMSTYTGLWRGVVSGMFEAVISPLVAVRMQKARAACEEAATEVFESGKTRCGFRYWVASRSTTPYGTALTRYVVDERLSLFYTANAIYPDDGGSVLTIFGGRTFREHLFEHAKAQYYGHPLPGFGTAFVNKNQDTGPYEAVFKAVEWWSNPLLAAFYDTERASWMGVLTPGKRSPRKPSDGAGCSLMMVVKAAEGREAVVTGTMGRGNYQMRTTLKVRERRGGYLRGQRSGVAIGGEPGDCSDRERPGVLPSQGPVFWYCKGRRDASDELHAPPRSAPSNGRTQLDRPYQRVRSDG